MILIRQYDIWLADLNPRFGTEPGKFRPVVVVQTDLLNAEHPSTLICPITTRVHSEASLLRVKLRSSQLSRPSAVLVDQVRAIDNRRLRSRVGELTPEQVALLREGLAVMFDF